MGDLAVQSAVGEKMKERPILFSGAMVRAILGGHKTQTRRVIKAQGVETDDATGKALFVHHPNCPNFCDYACGGSFVERGVQTWRWAPYGVPGDRLWVRESCLFRSECGGYICRSLDGGRFEAWTADSSIHYQHDGRIKTWEDAAKPSHPLPYCVGGYSSTKTGEKEGSFTLNLLKCDPSMVVDPWKGNTIVESLDVIFRRLVPAIHMPRWASRLTLEIVNVRVERLQDISEEDSRAEGVTDGGCLNCGNPEPCGCSSPKPDARDSYAHLWDTINGKAHPWHSNPWVWVVEFTKATTEPNRLEVGTCAVASTE